MGLYDPVQTITPMETLPDFISGDLYEIKVSIAVELAPNLWARPASPRIIVDGDKARELGDVVIWAQKV